MSSVTVACTVRSPSARLDSSSSSRRIACWLRSFWRACWSAAALQRGERTLQEDRDRERQHRDQHEGERQPRAREPAGGARRGLLLLGTQVRVQGGRRPPRAHCGPPASARAGRRARARRAAASCSARNTAASRRAASPADSGRPPIPSALSSPFRADTSWPMNTEAVGETACSSLDRRGAVGQRGQVLLDGLRTQLEALEVGRERLGTGRADRLGDVGRRGQQLRRELADRGGGAAAHRARPARPSSTAWVCSSSVDQPSRPPGRLRRRIRRAARASCARDSASASNAGADPRTAAPACSGMFCDKRSQRGRVARAVATAGARPGPTAATPAAAIRAATSATAISVGCSRAASSLLVMVRHPIRLRRPRAPGIRKPPPAGRPALEQVRTLNTGQTSGPRLNAPAR